MAVSDITAGRGKQSKVSIGGNSKVYLYNYIEDPFTVLAGEATAINAGLLSVFEFDIVGDGNTLEQSLAGDRNAFTSVNTQTLNLLLGKLDATTNANLNLLVGGFPGAVVKDRNGNYHAIGIDDGIDFTVASATGGGKADFNGYTLNGVSTTKELAPLLDTATVAALLLLVV